MLFGGIELAQKNKPVVLIAEDDEVNRDILREILKDGYEVIEAGDGKSAVSYIESAKTKLNLVIADIHMPVMDGFGVIEYLHKEGLSDRIPVIITTADQSADVLLLGKKYRVADIVYKPFKVKAIRKSVDALFEILKCERGVNDVISEKSEHFVNQYTALKKADSIRDFCWEDTIRLIMDELLPGGVLHRKRIHNYTRAVLDKLKTDFPKYRLTDADVDMISKCTLMHDIGSVVIPDEVYDKGDATSYRGLMQIRKRPVVGSELINLIFANSTHLDEKRHCYEICRYMRERFDGKGYPDGLLGIEIPVSAQVVGLVHRYDELRFKDGKIHSHKSSCNAILEAEYKAFNPDLIDLFEEISGTFEEISSQIGIKEK